MILPTSSNLSPMKQAELRLIIPKVESLGIWSAGTLLKGNWHPCRNSKDSEVCSNSYT